MHVDLSSVTVCNKIFRMRTFHKIISFVFQPLLMPTFGMLILVNLEIFVYMPFIWRLIAIVGTFLFTGILPALPILLMMRRGEVSDLFISKREQRTLPYMFSLLAYVFWTVFMWKTLQLPLFMVYMGIGTAVSILLITLINTKWKISAHLSGVGGFAGGLFGISYQMAYNPVVFIIAVFSISALVAISRIELKAHTPMQTLAGFSLGFVSIFISCLIA